MTGDLRAAVHEPTERAERALRRALGDLAAAREHAARGDAAACEASIALAARAIAVARAEVSGARLLVVLAGRR